MAYGVDSVVTYGGLTHCYLFPTILPLLRLSGLLVSQPHFPQISPLASFVPKASPNEVVYSVLGITFSRTFYFQGPFISAKSHWPLSYTDFLCL